MEKYLVILRDSLVQKNELLKELHMLSDEQERVLRAETFDADEFDTLVDKKDGLVDQIVQLDKGFETIYEKIRESLNQDKAKYAAQIKEIQTLVSGVVEKTTSLQAKEKRITTQLSNKIESMKKNIGQSRRGSKAAYEYYKSMAGMGTGAIPRFTDQP